jgi:hypothetical protein
MEAQPLPLSLPFHREWRLIPLEISLLQTLEITASAGLAKLLYHGLSHSRIGEQCLSVRLVFQQLRRLVSEA